MLFRYNIESRFPCFDGDEKKKYLRKTKNNDRMTMKRDAIATTVIRSSHELIFIHMIK